MLLVLVASLALAEDPAPPASPNDPNPEKQLETHEAHQLAQLSLEELMTVRVTSVSKRDQSVADAPAAVYVLSHNDIQRSGVTSIADALRLVPGLQVARQNGYEYAITARGFADQFANKLLVMIDGRSVYTPLFSGTYWQVQDTMLEDVDRIEIVRGPGATLWGANAVNGVINVITKSSRDTQGILVSGGGGIQEKGFGSVRYGDKINDQLHFRVYGKYFDREATYLGNDTRANDAWDMWRGGGRLDWEPSAENRFTFQSDAYTGQMQQTADYTDTSGGGLIPVTLSVPIQMNGQNVMARWQHDQSEEAHLEWQTYLDRTETTQARLQEIRHTFNTDLQQSIQLGSRNQLIMGAGYRVSSDQLADNFDVSFERRHRSLQLINAFVQDELTLIADRLRLVLGSKFEHNDFTGFEVQPSARMIWTPSAKHSAWLAVSRAVRTPSRAERDVRLNFVTSLAPTAYSIMSNPDLESEELIAYEVGYRVKLTERVALDWTGFCNRYDRLRIVPFYASGLDPAIAAALDVTQVRMGNQSQGQVYGTEIAATWNATDFWRLRPSYSFLSLQLHRDPGVGDASDEADEGNSPTHQASLQSSVDFPHSVQWDTIVRYVDRLKYSGIPAYTSLDMRVAWRPKPWMEWSIVGQNLLDDRHPEYRPTVFRTQSSEVPRTVFGKLTISF